MQALRVTVLGARGFVGSSFVRHLAHADPVELREVTRDSYAALAGVPSDVVIDASCNSKKYLAETDPVLDFEYSVAHRVRTLRDFPASFHIHISSVDVYSDLASPRATAEDAAIDRQQQSHYGCHKLLAEELVRHYGNRWLILRLAGMVGTGLRKNPVFDILNSKPLHIHPESRYQYMLTDEVAGIAMSLFQRGLSGEIFNVCGDGAISPAEIAAIAGRQIRLTDSARDGTPRIIDINVGKIRQLFPITSTRDCIESFVRTQSHERQN
jgi:nucleoside-diphosphate-sugar epimerase